MRVFTLLRLLRKFDTQAEVMIEVKGKGGGGVRYHAVDVFEPQSVANSSAIKKKVIITSVE